MITVDPGCSGMGWSFWKETKLIDFGNIYPKSGDKTFQKRTTSIDLQFLQGVLLKYHPDTVLIEFPEFQSGAVGQTAAQKGDTLALAYFVGFISSTCAGLGIQVELITPSKWKGNLKKEVVEQRVLKVLPGLKAKSHALDAIGIALYIQGKINQSGISK